MSDVTIKKHIKSRLDAGVSYDEIARRLADLLGLDERDTLEHVYEVMETTK